MRAVANSNVMLLACDTSGLQNADVPVSIAVARVELGESGEWTETGRWHALNMPPVPITPEAQAIHGLALSDVQGHVLDGNRMRASLCSVDCLVSWHPRFDAKMLAKLVPEVLTLNWYTYERHFTEHRDPLELPADRARAVARVDRMLGWMNVRRGKTKRSKTWLASLLGKGRSPVHPHVAGGLPVQIECVSPVSRIFAGNLTGCRVGTVFNLWTRPGMDHVVAYELGAVNGEGVCFHLPKAGNRPLADAMDRGDWVRATLRDVRDWTYVIEIGEPVPMPARSP